MSASVVATPCPPIPVIADVTRDCSARLALLELAAECAITTSGADDEALRLALVTHIVTAGARIRFLEGTNLVLRTHRVPVLEGQVRELTLDRSGWSDRARRAERRLEGMLWIGVAVTVTLGAAIVYLATRLPG